jgi:hypothetical protein
VEEKVAKIRKLRMKVVDMTVTRQMIEKCREIEINSRKNMQIEKTEGKNRRDKITN